MLMSNSSFSQWTSYNTSNSGLMDNYCWYIAADPKGDIWVSTQYSGANKLTDSTWINYTTSNSSIGGNFVCPVNFDKKGNTWIGSNGGGLSKFDGSNWTVYNTSNSGLPSNIVYRIEFDASGNVWVGTKLGGLAKFNDTVWTVYNTSNSGMVSNDVNALTFDKNGNIWVGTRFGGLTKFDGNSSWTNYNTLNSPIPNDSVYFLKYIYQTDILWVGTVGGLATLSDSTWAIYTTTNSGLPHNYIRSIAYSYNGEAWIATGGGGVARLVDTTWTVYNTSNSNLPSNMVWSVATDIREKVWVATWGGGIASINPFGDSITVIITSAVDNPGDTIELPDVGVVINFDSSSTVLSGDDGVTVTQYLDGLDSTQQQTSSTDSVATIFNNSYWNIFSYLDTFNVTVCFSFDSSQFNTGFLQYLSMVFQEIQGDPWQLITSVPTVTDSTICFTTNHWSNWALAITKSDSKMQIDTVFYNQNVTPIIYTKEFSQSGITFKTKLNAGETDTIFVARYDINPGGNAPAEIQSYLNTFWEIRNQKKDTTALFIDATDIEGFLPEQKQNYVVLNRAGVFDDWKILPTLRVKRNSKEVLFVQKDTLFGQFLIGVSSKVQPYFTDSIVFTPACAGDSILFSSVIDGGTPPYTYSWTGDVGLSGTTETLGFVYPNMGQYSVTLKVEDTFGAETEYISTVNIGCTNRMVDNVPGKNPVFFPNPTENGIMYLSFSGHGSHNIIISVCDLFGRKVYSHTTNLLENIRMNLSHLNSGSYIVHVKTKDKEYREMVRVK